MVSLTTQRKLEELGYSIKRNASYFFIYNSEGEYIKTCHGFKSLSEYVCREYRKKGV